MRGRGRNYLKKRKAQVLCVDDIDSGSSCSKIGCGVTLFICILLIVIPIVLAVAVFKKNEDAVDYSSRDCYTNTEYNYYRTFC